VQTVPRRVWRASSVTLLLVGLLVLIGLVAIPGLAYLVWVQRQDLSIPVALVVLGLLVSAYGWRFGLHPRIDADQRLMVVNPFDRSLFEWHELTIVRPGEDGLILAAPGHVTAAWCVQKSALATRRGWVTRADRVAFDLVGLADRHDPGPLRDQPDARVRRARHDEVRRLARLERTVATAELPHIFPPEVYPYPFEDIVRRWRRLLRDPRIRVRILEVNDAPAGYLAFDDARVRQLGVLPRWMGRRLGTMLLEYACAGIFAAGVEEAHLWVLADNTKARTFLRSRGWTDTGRRRDCEFPPYPQEVLMVRRRARPALPAEQA
jgi:GNAT superfamily N-acetyltransferase